MTDATEMPRYDGMEYEELVAAAQFLWMENAELRKLARGLNWCTEWPDGPRVDCEHCPLGEVEGKPLELMCEVMMRELGIEVSHENG